MTSMLTKKLQKSKERRIRKIANGLRYGLRQVGETAYEIYAIDGRFILDRVFTLDEAEIWLGTKGREIRAEAVAIQ